MPQEQIRALVRRYLGREINRSAFAEQFAGLYLRVRNSRDASAEARSLCNSLVLPFAELSRGHRSEESFRQAIRPFAGQSRVYAYPVEMVVGEPIFTATSTSSAVEMELAVA
jgi:hypothetical protein